MLDERRVREGEGARELRPDEHLQEPEPGLRRAVKDRYENDRTAKEPFEILQMFCRCFAEFGGSERCKGLQIL